MMLELMETARDASSPSSVPPTLFDEFLVVGQRKSQQPLPHGPHGWRRMVGQLVLADFDQYVNGAARLPEALLGLVGALLFAVVADREAQGDHGKKQHPRDDG